MEPLTIQTTIYLHTTFHRDHCSRERSQADKMLVICNHSSSSEMPTNQEAYKIRHVREISITIEPFNVQSSASHILYQSSSTH